MNYRPDPRPDAWAELLAACYALVLVAGFAWVIVRLLGKVQLP